MLSTHSLLLFSGAALLLLVTPGPAVLYIVARSASQGRQAGLASVAGIHVGTAVHVAAAVVGLSAVIVASSMAFTTVKLAGAAYLITVGVRTLLAARRDHAAHGPGFAPPEQRPLRQVFGDGVVLNVLNPKTAVFFLAFVPQFVDAEAGHTTLQLLVLGGLFIAIGLVSDSAYALTAAWLGSRIGTSARFARRKDLVAGTTFIGLGLTTAVTGHTAET